MRNVLTKCSIFALLFVLLGVMANAQDARVATVQQPPASLPSFAGYVPDAIVVKFDRPTVDMMNPALKAGGRVGIERIDAVSQRFNVYNIEQRFPTAKPVTYLGKVVDLYGWHRISFREGMDIQAMVDAYKSLPGVLDAQPIGIHRLDVIANDSRFADQWHLNQGNDHDMDAPEAWDVETGDTGIIVADLDTGVRYFHKDLGGANASYSSPTPANIDGNIWKNLDEIPGNGVDDDNNGYIDDWVGWDFLVSGSSCYPGEDCGTPDNDPRDFNGHGTHTAGIVAAINNNGYAVASVAGGWMSGAQAPSGNGVKVMPLRIGWSAGRSYYEVGYVSMDAAAAAFVYAAQNGARIATCSWGNSNTGGLADAVNTFLASGGMIFNSAGNSNNESPSYLCSRADVIAVASTEQNDLKSDFSSYGTWVDISAPGTAIWSTYHNHADPANDYVASLSGTSMSCPNAAAVAALIWSQNSGMTAAEVQQKLFDTADDLDALNPSYAGKLGAGRVNAFNAVSGGTPVPPPAAPTNLVATAVSSSQINLTWNDVSDNESGFKVYRSTDGVNFSLIATLAAQTTSYQNTGLTASTLYYYKVAAYNAGGASESDVASATTQAPPPPPAAPTGLTATAVSSSQIDLSWTDASTDEDGFNIYRGSVSGPGKTKVGSVAAGVTTYHDGGLTASTTYFYQVTAYNVGGESGFSSEASATTQASTTPTMHVASVVVVKESFNNRKFRGRATVKIVDAANAAVANATVTGQWSGGATDTDQFTTGSTGEGTAYSNWSRTNTSFQFCVTNVTKTGWVYNPDANVGGGCGSVASFAVATMPADGGAVTGRGLEVEGQAPGLRDVQNYPNPLNPSTTIEFALEAPTHVTIDIYDMLGRKIATLIDADTPKGVVSATWHGVDEQGTAVGSGPYIYVIRTGDGTTVSRKMLLLK